VTFPTPPPVPTTRLGAPLLDAALVVGSRIYIAGGGTVGGTVVYSDDLGNTWAGGPIPGATGFLRTLISASGSLYAGVASTPDQAAIAASVDAGAHWTVLPSDAQPFPGGSSEMNALAAHGGVLVAGGLSTVGQHSLAYATPVVPPTRQYPRDDNQALGSVRQGRSSSVQGSIRQGWRGTYS
jgi:hypothetical protein